MGITTTTPSSVPSYFLQRLTSPGLIGLIIETAGNHAVTMWGRTETGFASAVEMGSLILVMTRLSVRMDPSHTPRWGDTLEVATYFRVRGKAGAVREWIVTDVTTKRVVATATSSWVMVDLETRRLARIPAAMLDAYNPYSPAAEVSLPELPVLATPAVPAVVEPRAAATVDHSLRRADVDMNAHVTTGTYVAWITSLPWQDLVAPEGSLEVTQVDVEFKNECRGTEGVVRVVAAVEEEEEGGTGGGVVFSLKQPDEKVEEGGKAVEYARARISYTK